MIQHHEFIGEFDNIDTQVEIESKLQDMRKWKRVPEIINKTYDNVCRSRVTTTNQNLPQIKFVYQWKTIDMLEGGVDGVVFSTKM